MRPTGGWRVGDVARGRRAERCREARWRLPRWLTAEHPLPWLLPMFAMLLSCGIYPLLYSVWLSFQERSRVTRQYEFVGLKQWQAAFTDERMWHALGVTCTYTAGGPGAAAGAGHGAGAAAGQRPARLRLSARADDLAAGGAARRHRHDVPAHAGRPVRRAQLLHGPARPDRHRPSLAGDAVNRPRRPDAGRPVAMDPVHGPDLRGRPARPAQGAVRGGFHRRRLGVAAVPAPDPADARQGDRDRSPDPQRRSLPHLRLCLRDDRRRPGYHHRDPELLRRPGVRRRQFPLRRHA